MLQGRWLENESIFTFWALIEKEKPKNKFTFYEN